MGQWTKTQRVIQRKGDSGAIPREQRVVQTDHGLRINPEYLKHVTAENRRLIEILAEDDGPVEEGKQTA